LRSITYIGGIDVGGNKKWKNKIQDLFLDMFPFIHAMRINTYLNRLVINFNSFLAMHGIVHLYNT